MSDNVKIYLFSKYLGDEFLKRNVCLITFDAGVKAKNVMLSLKIYPERRFDKMLLLNLGSKS